MLQRWQHMALALRCCSCLLVLQEHLAACSRLPSCSAIMFLPSEAVHAEINLQLPKLVEESRRKRVYMAGPDNLMLLLHTVRAILRDARMHEAAGKIQAEVDTMMQDVGRLDERVRKLASHFGQVEKDIDDIQTSTRKIISRGNRITQIDVGEEEAPCPGLPVEPE
mgnify:CR=1 FL=1